MRYFYVIDYERILSRWVLSAILLLTTLVGHAQRPVKGQVISEDDRQGIPGINILIKNTTQGTVTDATGNFQIQAEPNAVLVFSGVGFIKQEVPVNGKSQLDVKLVVDNRQLNEVVVVGYGTQKKSDFQ